MIKKKMKIKKLVRKPEVPNLERRPVDLQELLKVISTESNVVVSSQDLLSDPKFLIPTGCFVLDTVIKGGIPTGRMVEVFGEDGAGKSTLVTQIAIQCQGVGGQVYLIDHEAGLDKDRAAYFGLDLDKMGCIENKTCEEVFIAVKDILEKQADLAGIDFPTLIIWDTIASSQTQKEKEARKWKDGREVAGKSRVIHDIFRRLTTLLASHNAAMLFVNQVRTQIGSYVTMTDSPGGWAMKHYPSIRIRLSKDKALYEPILDSDGSPKKLDAGDKGILIGVTIKFRIVKSKVSVPGSVFRVPLYFDRGFDDTVTIFKILKRAGVLVPSGNWYKVQINITEEQAIAVSTNGVSVETEEGETFLKFNGEGKWEEMIASCPGILDEFKRLVRENRKYV